LVVLALKQRNELTAINIIPTLGLWTAVAPWVLGFASAAAATWTHVGVGLAIAILAAVQLWLIRSDPPAKVA